MMVFRDFVTSFELLSARVRKRALVLFNVATMKISRVMHKCKSGD